MSSSTLIKPTHKSIISYYGTLQSLSEQNVSHEMGLRRAFQELLAETAKLHDWTLIPEESSRTTAGNAIRPDATLRDKNTLPRGFWEAKDTNDSLTKEIAKKSAKGYSLANTIFEDTQSAILYQNKKQAFVADLANPQDLCDLLNLFYSHTEPDFEHWEEAVTDFKDRVPQLAEGLVSIIDTAHKKNPQFKAAFTDFFTLCQTALNPNIAEKAVDEMLIQHILTERLFRTIFKADKFLEQNVIAAEVEKVINALTSSSFSREEYLKSLDRFYLAIEGAAHHLEWTDKQHFLNVIYERFFQGYSIKTADTMGIVYTPQPIVDFMRASVAEVLKSEFKKDLGDPDVFLLDPCTGTGNFIINLLRRVPSKNLENAFGTNFFANEILLMAYYIAALNIEHAHYERVGTYSPFEGLCFVDSLDLAEAKQLTLGYMNPANAKRVERQKKAPITVIIANPPYNMAQQNENDNNKNRKYPEIDKRIRNTYAKDSAARLNSKLYDPYVRFFRWAVDRLGDSEGFICFVTNNSFVHKKAFDSMRKNFFRDFLKIWHLDLQGDVKENPKLSGTAYNVFGVQVGIGITVAVRKGKANAANIQYASVPKNMPRNEKLRWLSTRGSLEAVAWNRLTPDGTGTWIPTKNSSEFQIFCLLEPLKQRLGKTISPKTIFQTYTLGVSTNRDDTVYDFSRTNLESRIADFAEHYAAEISRYERHSRPKDLDSFIDYSKIKWSRNLKRSLRMGEVMKYDPKALRTASYRPFTRRHLYFEDIAIDELGLIRRLFPKPSLQNLVICCTDHAQIPFSLQMCDAIPDAAIGGRAGQCFPFYIYDEDGSNRRENITDWALDQFRSHYNDKKISKWNIFHYVYALLHHPAYRTKFADNLKRELPRIPFAPPLPQIKNPKSKSKNPVVVSVSSVPSVVNESPSSAFHAFANAGKKLADLHLNYESAKEFPLTEIITPGHPRSPRVDSKMKLSKDKSQITVNDSLTLTGIPPETFNYKLGNRSALEWIIDQYQLYTDPRTQITSDPNAWGDEHQNPEYIPQLLARIITVSLETQKIVNALPAPFPLEKV